MSGVREAGPRSPSPRTEGSSRGLRTGRQRYALGPLTEALTAPDNPMGGNTPLADRPASECVGARLGQVGAYVSELSRAYRSFQDAKFRNRRAPNPRGPRAEESRAARIWDEGLAVDGAQIVLVFEVGDREVLDALQAYASRLWSEVDEAMATLWLSESERARARREFGPESIVVAAPVVDSRGTALVLDTEADQAAEFVSGTTGAFTLSLQLHTARSLKLTAFHGGKQVAWVFWTCKTQASSFGEVLSAVESAAVACGGWIGDVGGIEELAKVPQGSIRRLLDDAEASPETLMASVVATLGFRELPRVIECTYELA